jgi:nitrite reductase/ring-hydroxylating ferredoxin subunit
MLDTGLRSTSETTESDQSMTFHRSWFPVALASEIATGKAVGKDFLGTRVVVYRDGGGKPVVQGAYCPHLGADLSVGDVVDGQIRCAYHHWSFDGSGACVHIPTGDKIPPGARIATYPSAEAWGLVWAFNGETPLFDVPRIPDVEEHEVAYDAQLRGIQPIEPWVARSNGVDFQHLRTLHKLPVFDPDTIDVSAYRMEYRIEVKPVGFLQHGLITGTNTFAQHLRIPMRGDMFMMFTGSPLRANQSTYFSVVGVPRDTADERPAEERLKAALAFADKLYADDAPVLTTIRFRKGVLVASDRHLSRFFKYVAEFPRSHPL